MAVSFTVLLLKNLDVFLKDPDFSIWFWTAMFSMPIFLFITACVVYHNVGRTYSRTFPIDYPDVARLIEAVLKREGIPFVRDPHKPRRLFFMRLNAVIKIKEPRLLIQIIGTSKPGWLNGSASQVYVGKFTKENKEFTRKLLKEFDEAGKPSLPEE